ncbi:MAG: hypothetical protein LBN06_04870 [Prevotellaceae bacterium]|nr:hypothetical protein [Prevotellaceae bacterium]
MNSISRELLVALVCSLCMLSFLAATILCLHHYLMLGKHQTRRHILCLIVAYAFCTLAYGMPTLRILNVDLFIRLRPLYVLFSAYGIIFSFKFIFLITQIGTPRRFGWWNYAVPVLLTIGLWVWTGGIPYTMRHQMLTMSDRLNGDDPLIYNIYRLLPWICSIYILSYGSVVFFYIKKYRDMIVNYSASEEHTSFGWLYVDYALIIASSLLPVARMSFYWGYTNVLFLYPIILPVWVMLVVYNAIKGSYVLVPTLAPEEEKTSEEEGEKKNQTRVGIRLIDRHQFERYMEEKKPYLNPDLCITDMVLDLCTNRTYLSNYINKEYGVNFKTLINGYRLRELERLRKQQTDKTKKKGNMDLVLEAGFGSYRSYLSSSKREYKEHKLPFNKVG